MSSTVIASLVIACTLVGIAIGAILRARMPDHHVRDDSKDLIKTASGMIATLVALVLGLLVASAKGTFDTASAGIGLTSAKIIQLDRDLAQYGPETQSLRESLRAAVAGRIQQLWPTPGSAPVTMDAFQDATGLETLKHAIRHLTPTNDDQRQLQAQALHFADDIEQLRWQMFVQSRGQLPAVFLGILLFWLLVLYLSFGLLAPRNPTAYAAMLVCAISIAGAVFLISEMNRPLDGLIRVSDVPMRTALKVITPK